MIEERIQRQHETMRSYQQQNLYFLSTLQNSVEQSEQQIIQLRTNLLQTELETSTIVVTEDDLVEVNPSNRHSVVTATLSSATDSVPLGGEPSTAHAAVTPVDRRVDRR